MLTGVALRMLQAMLLLMQEVFLFRYTRYYLYMHVDELNLICYTICDIAIVYTLVVLVLNPVNYWSW